MRKILLASLVALALPAMALAHSTSGYDPSTTVTTTTSKTITSINSGGLAETGASLGGNGYESSSAVNTGHGTTTGSVTNLGGVPSVNTTTSDYDTGAVQATGNGAATASEVGQASTGFTSINKIKSVTISTTTQGFNSKF